MKARKFNKLTLALTAGIFAVCISFIAISSFADPAPSTDSKAAVESGHANKLDAAIEKMKQRYEERYGVVRDPYHPFFDPENFEFEYFTSKCMRQEIVAKLFPPGSSKALVEHILVARGGASAEISKRHADQVIYSYTMKRGLSVPLANEWIVAVQYDDAKRVKSISMGGKDVYDYPAYCAPAYADSPWRNIE